MSDYPECFGSYIDLVDSSNNWKRVCEGCPVELECYHISFMEDDEMTEDEHYYDKLGEFLDEHPHGVMFHSKGDKKTDERRIINFEYFINSEIMTWEELELAPPEGYVEALEKRNHELLQENEKLKIKLAVYINSDECDSLKRCK